MSDGAEPKKLDLDEAIAVLERTPGVLRAWLSGLPVLGDRESAPEAGS